MSTRQENNFFENTLDYKNFRGYVDCDFTAEIELVTCPEKSNMRRKRPAFFLKNSKFSLQSGKSTLLDIFFEPQWGGKSHGTLTIKMDQNPEDIVIMLSGYGMAPKLLFQESSLSFDPILPHTANCEKFFTVENTSSFPVEFFFADFDK